MREEVRSTGVSVCRTHVLGTLYSLTQQTLCTYVDAYTSISYVSTCTQDEASPRHAACSHSTV